jgi:hypothetical protein
VALFKANDTALRILPFSYRVWLVFTERFMFYLNEQILA